MGSVYILLTLIIVCIVYIKAFKDEFTEEKIAKASISLIVLGLMLVVIAVISRL